MRRWLSGVPAVVLVPLATGLLAMDWGLPCTDTWAPDALSPRASGLGALVEVYTPGHFHIYPPLHLLVLTLVALPWILLAVLRVGTNPGRLEQELIQPAYMTPVELGARLVAVAMAIGIVLCVYRLWERWEGARVARWAALIAALNPVLVYYAHTGNLEVPYMFWIMATLVLLDAVARGEPRELACVLCATAAVLTKDQSAAALMLVLPLGLVLLRPSRGLTDALRPRLLVAAGGGLAVFLAASGALTNPSGFRSRLALLLGPASQDWAEVPRGLAGTLVLLRALLVKLPLQSSLVFALASVAGVVWILLRRQGLERGRRLVPFAAAVSFTLFFTLGARRTDERFLLPHALLVLPYAAPVLDGLLRQRWRVLRYGGYVVVALGLGAAGLGVASLEATLLFDPRYEVERVLATLAPATRVEVYGGPHFLPRFPRALDISRVGTDPLAERSHMPSVTEVLGLPEEITLRRPDYVLISSEFANDQLIQQMLEEGRVPYGVRAYSDRASWAFFRALSQGELSYHRVLRARCRLPWPLDCRRTHGSAGGELWLFARGG
ncbi:MAG: glycosyltransferase family 39 protein [Myxococcales bacterium]